MVAELVDTTEMYLKTIYEMEEDGVTPLRARIVERLGHSGPTVSQTVSRMERDGLVRLMGDRRLEFTREGRARATEVMRKHRLAERLLLDCIGLDWPHVHDEACRWEHVMSDAVESRLVAILGSPRLDPYGNAVPGFPAHCPQPASARAALRGRAEANGAICRIGEPIQADVELLERFDALGLRPGAEVRVARADGFVRVSRFENREDSGRSVGLPTALAPHLFLRVRRPATRTREGRHKAVTHT